MQREPHMFTGSVHSKSVLGSENPLGLIYHQCQMSKACLNMIDGYAKRFTDHCICVCDISSVLLDSQ